MIIKIHMTTHKYYNIYIEQLQPYPQVKVSISIYSDIKPTGICAAVSKNHPTLVKPQCTISTEGCDGLSLKSRNWN
jgi:hypothetical protein